MKTPTRSLGRGLIAAVLIAAVVNTGCSLIGLTIGAIVDVQAKPTTIPGWEVQSLKRGASVTLVLRDGTKVAGTYQGLAPDPNGAASPASDPPAGLVASAWDVLLETAAGTRERVAFARVARVELPPQKGAAQIGFLIGGLIDVAVLAWVANALGDLGGGSGEFCSPLISSFDGHRYVPEVDAFGGAMFKRAKRTDWAPLEAVRPVQGRYRLRIEKGHAETEFVDEIQMVVVDHPPGVRVRPDPNGTLRTLASPSPPLRAQALDGGPVLDLVAKRDGRFWVSSPFGRDPDDASTVRDGIVLEFARPAASRSVKLALRTQNTPWAYYLRGEFLSLLGRDFDTWYARMEGSPEAYGDFRQALLREVMLTVALWDGTRWQPTGSVWEVGSAIPRDVVLPLELAQAEGDRLRVRLDATAGLWMIDAVEADYSSDLSVRRREIAPSVARDESGRDVTAALARADGRAYVMRGSSAKAEVDFSMPPPVAGLDRTVVLKATGHYRIDPSGVQDREPQIALVERFVTEPGTWGQHTLRVLKAHVERAVAQMKSTALP